MRIQDLAIVFLIIILPISIILAAYTQYQIQTINTQTLYDNKLSSATYDALRAFQLNTADNTYETIGNSKARDLQSAVTTFKNLVMSTFSLDGYSQDDLDSYIPALVYTLYDGFYIYSPYTNENYRFETKKDDNGDDITDARGNVEYDNGRPKDGNGDRIYGVKPYITYSCRYVKGNIDVVITYALDNHITVQGMIGQEYINKGGYLIDNIKYDETTEEVDYNGVEISEEHLKEYLPTETGGKIYSYMKLYRTKYYLDGETIVSIDGNKKPYIQYTNGMKEYDDAKKLIENNIFAKDYYKEAYEFTTWLKNTELVDLTYGDAIDTIVDENGDLRSQETVWAGNNTKIFKFNSSDTDYSKNIENELSNFSQHRLAVIKHKIEINLAIAIANYNAYSGVNNVFQMPNLKENEWDYIIHNISLISFLQGLPIGGKIYNGYSIATNSESKEVVLEPNIYILCKDENDKKEYCRVGDRNINKDNIYSGYYANGDVSAGRLNLDFRRETVVINGETHYYYPIQDYNPSYNSIVMQNNVDTYDDIYVYVNNQSEELKQAFYTALGRERVCNYKKLEDYIN